MPVDRGTKYNDIIMFFEIKEGWRGEFLSPGWRISS
jgi:hypothetical protein